MFFSLAALFVIGLFAGCTTQSSPRTGFNVLVFSKTLMYRHASITNGIAAIQKLGMENGFFVEATEDASWFTPANLARYKAVIFLSTSGDVLNDVQQTAFREFIERGGGLVGIHAAVAGDVATEGGWPWYGEALCAQFTNHSAIVEAAIDVEDARNPSTSWLPKRWVRTDEWYNFIASPARQSARARVPGRNHLQGRHDGRRSSGGVVQADRPWPRVVHRTGPHGSEFYRTTLLATSARRDPRGGWHEGRKLQAHAVSSLNRAK